MARKRTEMRRIREVLRLRFESGFSSRAIAKAQAIARTTVLEYLRRASVSGLSWPLPHDLDGDDALEAVLFPASCPALVKRPEPDWTYISRELKRKGVTLQLLWQEYRASHPGGYGYTQFTVHYRRWLGAATPTYRNRHRAGDAMQVDYAGHKVAIFDPETGELREASILVAVLPASNLTYAEASWGQSLPEWIDSHRRAFGYFGGVPRSLVSDNLKPAVTKPLWFEPSLNRTYEAMATHYGTAVLPTRVRKPRDKAKIESAVRIVGQSILARLRNRQFFSLGELNDAIGRLLEELNNQIMKGYGKSRRALFEELERSTLRPLPDEPFEYAEWKSAKVHTDYHIEVQKHWYSVPYSLLGKKVDVRLTHRSVEIFHKAQRVAAHRRTSARPGHTTIDSHMPRAHRRYANTTPATLIERARRVGPNCAILVKRLMADRPHPEQGFRASYGVLSLKRQYPDHRLEAACERALQINAVSYSSLKSILKTGIDQSPPATDPPRSAPKHRNIRGPAYFL